MVSLWWDSVTFSDLAAWKSERLQQRSRGRAVFDFLLAGTGWNLLFTAYAAKTVSDDMQDSGKERLVALSPYRGIFGC